jgi:hypothetical protein
VQRLRELGCWPIAERGVQQLAVIYLFQKEANALPGINVFAHLIK